MIKIRTSRRTLSVAATIAAAGAAGLVTLSGGGASASPPPFVLNGAKIANSEFSFAALQSPDVQKAIDSRRAELSDTCMASRRFAAPPVENAVTNEDKKYTAAYADAVIGDDVTSNKAPEPTAVRLPDGSNYELLVSWRPDTCAYQSYDALSGDPFLREALRQQIMIYQAQAGADIEKKLADAAAGWSTCVGNDELATADLLREIDGGRLRNDVDPGKASDCLSEDLVNEAVTVRAEAELAIANEHRSNVDAWIDVLEREAAAFGA
jgi:hypothetical protein